VRAGRADLAARRKCVEARARVRLLAGLASPVWGRVGGRRGGGREPGELRRGSRARRLRAGQRAKQRGGGDVRACEGLRALLAGRLFARKLEVEVRLQEEAAVDAGEHEAQVLGVAGRTVGLPKHARLNLKLAALLEEALGNEDARCLRAISKTALVQLLRRRRR